ncbi:MAG: UTP--glucose-1-phosphate uridylyltransferase, partial [Planctomycetota bacterium]
MEELSPDRKKALQSQIEQLDFQKIPEWVEKYVKNDGSVKIPDHLDPAPSYPYHPQTTQQIEKYAKAVKVGEDLIRAGKVAGFVVAGGQGTRLGFDGPKGNYPISPVKNKTLFQIFAENLLATANKYDTTIPFYIMTSP